MKKSSIVAIIMVFVLLFSTMPSFAATTYNDVQDTNLSTVLDRLAKLNIISGYTDATFRPNAPVTRAQFAKMIVCAMDKSDMALSNSGATRFNDVPQGHWAIPYINYVSQNGIIAGYPNGSFAPEQPISVAQAVTVLLRMLSYTDSEIGIYWPDNYIEKANNIEITKGVSRKSQEALNRSEVAILIDNALLTDIKDGSKKFLESIGYQIIKNVLIISTSKEDDSLASNEVRTSSGVYKLKSDMPIEIVSLADKIIIDKDGKLVFVIKSTDPITTSTLDTLGYSIIKQCYIMDDKTVAVDQIKTSSGVYTVRNNAVLSMTNKVVDLLLDKNKNVVVAYPENMTTYAVAVNKVLDNQVEYISNGVTGTYRFDADFTVYMNSLKTTYSSIKSQITTGTQITFYGYNDGAWEFIVVKAYNDTITPFIAEKDIQGSETVISGRQIKADDTLKVYKNGLASSLSEIKKNDVIYYNTNTNIIEAFDKKVTGIYDEALPNKAYVNQVVLGGKTYTLSTTKAMDSLGENTGSFKIGEKITLLLGKNDVVIAATDLSSDFSFDYAVVANTYTKLSTDKDTEGKLKYMAKLFMLDGQVYDFETDKDYKDYKGELVKVTFSNGTAQLNYLTTYQTSGDIDKVNRTIGADAVVKDVKIIEQISNVGTSDTQLQMLDFDKTTLKTIDEKDVITLVRGNAFGDIQVLYLGNVTKSQYKYGIVTKRIVNSSDRGITVDINGVAISTKVMFGVKQATPVTVNVSGGQITDMTELTKIVERSGAVDAIEEGRIRLGGKVYKMDYNAVFYRYNNFEYIPISINDLKSKNVNFVELYSDKTINEGGTIKVIVATFK